MVVEGSGAINEWRLTGEPLPVSKRASDQLIGATMNTSGSLVCPFREATAPSVSRLQLASSIQRMGWLSPLSRCPGNGLFVSECGG